MTTNTDDLLHLSKDEQTKIVDSLIAKSKTNSPYNLMLIASAIIIACGLLMDNMAIVIGGMLVTPVLTPILTLGLGFSCGEVALIRRSLKITATSLATVIIISALLAFVFRVNLEHNFVLNAMIDGGSEIPILYMIVALASGAIATFAWAHKNIYEALPGVAVAVSLIPPLSAFGIAFGIMSMELLRVSLMIFVLNFLGVFLGSLTSFSTMSFYKAKTEAHKQVVKEELEEEKKQREKEKEKKNGNK